MTEQKKRQCPAGTIFLLIVLGLSLNNFADESKPFDHPGGLYTQQQLDTVRQNLDHPSRRQAYQQLTDQAENYLSYTPQPVADYNVPYYYANKNTPSTAKEKLSNDAYAAFTLALAYQLNTSKKRLLYADKAVEILNAWARTNRTISGYDGHLTACYCGIPMVLAAELLSDNPNWKQPDRQAFKTWLKNTLQKSADAIKHKKTNWGCWGLYASLACNHYLDDTAEFTKDIALLHRQITAMIDKNGQLPSECKRTNSGMWYTYFALCPMTCSAAIASNTTGSDDFTSSADSGKSIKSALDAFFVYCKDPDAWPYEKPTGLTGAVYNTFYPSADVVKKPSPASWPANLYEAMRGKYAEMDWDLWLSPHRPIHGGRGWLWPSVTTLNTATENH